MAHRLTTAEVERVAALARLDLTAEEKALYASQLDRILDYAGQLAELDIEHVAATASEGPGHPAERDDAPRPTLDRAEALANAPDAAAGLFRVPKVLRDG